MLQVLLIIGTGGHFEVLKVRWPMYALYAAYWTVTAALNVGTGPSFGAVLGLFAINALVEYIYGQIFGAFDALLVALLSVCGAILVLALVGLIRGRLEFLRLNSRGEVARLFTAAVVVLVVTGVLTDTFGGTRPAGKVTFGHDFTIQDGGAVIAAPVAQFAPGEQFAYVVTLSRPARTTRLDVLLISVTGGGQSVLQRTTVDVANPDFQVFWNKSPALLLDPGDYIIRYVDGGDVLAEGTFTVRSR